MPLDWAQLIAGSASDRRAIYGERFPARWQELESSVGRTEFGEHEAGQLLTVFATHWEHLPRVPERGDIRYHLAVLQVRGTVEHVAVAFYGRALRPDRIVVAYPMIVRRS